MILAKFKVPYLALLTLCADGKNFLRKGYVEQVI